MNTIDYIFSGLAIFILSYLSYRYYVVRKKQKALEAEQTEIEVAFKARRHQIRISETLEIDFMTRESITDAMRSLDDKAKYEMTLILPFRFHNDLYWNEDFHGYFDPITKIKEYHKGNLGKLFGVKVEVDSLNPTKSYLSKPCLIWKD